MSKGCLAIGPAAAAVGHRRFLMYPGNADCRTSHTHHVRPIRFRQWLTLLNIVGLHNTASSYCATESLHAFNDGPFCMC